MPDDRLEDGLHAYAEKVSRTAYVAPAGQIRRRAARRRQRRVAGAAFGLVLVAAIGVGLALGRSAGPDTPATPASPSVTPASPPPTLSGTKSDVSQLRQVGIDLGVGVLIDVADDGQDRWMQIGENGVVDFTGTKKDDSTMMSLQAAPVGGRNRVLIKPPFYNEDAEGPGYCVAAAPGNALTLSRCVPGDETQTWRILPAGDSGQFQLEGRYGIVRVDNRKGLQTIPFSR